MHSPKYSIRDTWVKLLISCSFMELNWFLAWLLFSRSQWWVSFSGSSSCGMCGPVLMNDSSVLITWEGSDSMIFRSPCGSRDVGFMPGWGVVIGASGNNSSSWKWFISMHGGLLHGIMVHCSSFMSGSVGISSHSVLFGINSSWFLFEDSLFDFLFWSSDDIIDLMSNGINLDLSVESLSDGLIWFNKSFEFLL